MFIIWIWSADTAPQRFNSVEHNAPETAEWNTLTLQEITQFLPNALRRHIYREYIMSYFTWAAWQPCVCLNNAAHIYLAWTAHCTSPIQKDKVSPNLDHSSVWIGNVDIRQQCLLTLIGTKCPQGLVLPFKYSLRLWPRPKGVVLLHKLRIRKLTKSSILSFMSWKQNVTGHVVIKIALHTCTPNCFWGCILVINEYWQISKARVCI